ncbi:MAG TPA: CopG family transcriptional regulator [Acetobacteraceae bacterium]|nr:CopG family transcriptional regulator [Acetobacteraceae bacterium]
MSARNAATKTVRGKRQFLVHLDATLIRRIKILAIDRNVSASSLVQEALLAFLAATGNPNPPSRNQGDPS